MFNAGFNSIRVDLLIKITVLDFEGGHCNDELQDEENSTMHVSRPIFSVSLGAPLHGCKTDLQVNGTVLDFAWMSGAMIHCIPKLHPQLKSLRI